MSKNQLNLTALRKSVAMDIAATKLAPPTSPIDSLRQGFTRREWLGLVGGGIVALGGLAGRPQSDLKLTLLSRRAEIRLRRKLLWAIDCDHFDGSPTLTGKQQDGQILLALRNALYPGTRIPADLRCRLEKRNGDWRMLLDLDFPGISLRDNFLQWVTNQSSVNWTRLTGTTVPFHGVADLILGGKASIKFFPQFFYQFAGCGVASLSVGAAALASDALAFGLGPLRVPTLLRERLLRRTIFTVSRGERDWLLPPSLKSQTPWNLDAKENGFSQISIETGRRRDGRTASALMAESAPEGAVYSFQPAPECGCDPENKPFALDVTNVRYAISHGPEGREAAIFGSIASSETWEHPSGARLLLGAGGDEAGPSFEVIDREGDETQVKAEPALLAVDMPLGSDSCSRIEFDQPPKFPCCLGSPSLWHRLLYFLHLSRPEDKLVLPLDGARLSITRPRDLLRLDFRFKGLALRCEDHKGRLIPAPEGGERLILVDFPPQHVAERAFFKSNETSKFQNPNPNDPDAGCPIEELLPPGSVASRLSGPSTLVFRIPEGEISYLLTTLLDWTQWEQVVSAAATVAGQKAPEQTVPSEQRIAGNVTKIELPYRLYLSPHGRAGWINPTALPDDVDDAPVELWQTRLGLRRQRELLPAPQQAQREEGDAGKAQYEVDERATPIQTVRAIWSEDYPIDLKRPPCFEGARSVPFRNSLEKRDRYEIVDLSSNFELKLRKNIKVDYSANPVDVEQLALSSMGAWLKSKGSWDPPSNAMDIPLVVEGWEHKAQMGRDSHVQVMYKGYLFPLGYRASLVKITQRLYENLPDGTIRAYLRQTLHIVPSKEEKTYKADGQPYDSRTWPFQRITIKTTETPPLDDPNVVRPGDAISELHRGQQLFWPQVGGKDFLFEYKLETLDGTKIDTVSPLIFLDVSVAFGACGQQIADACKLACGPDDQKLPSPPRDLIGEVIRVYNLEGPRRQPNFKGQKISYAPNTKEGGTNYETTRLTLEAKGTDNSIPLCPDVNQPGHSLRERDQPPFYPSIQTAEVKIPGVAELVGGAGLTWVAYYPTYVAKGFDATANKGEIFLEFEKDSLIPLNFGGNDDRAGSDKVGGVATPSTTLVGVSRSVGPVGAKAQAGASPQLLAAATRAADDSLKDISQGNFDPSKYFGDAKILGGIKLSDIIKVVVGQLLDETKAPQMIREVENEINSALPEIDRQLNGVAQKLIDYVQGLPPEARKVANPEADALVAAANEFKNASGLAKPAKLPAIRTAITQFIAKLNSLVRNPSRLLRAFFPDWVAKVEGLLRLIEAFRSGRILSEVQALIREQLNQLGQQAADAFKDIADEVLRQAAEEVRRELDVLRDEFQAKLASIVEAAKNQVPFNRILAAAAEVMDSLEKIRKRLRELQAMLDVARQNFEALRQNFDLLLGLIELPPEILSEQIRLLVIELCVDVPEISQLADRVRETLGRLAEVNRKGVALIREQVMLVENTLTLVDRLRDLINPASGGPSPLAVTPAGVPGPKDAADKLIALLLQVGNKYSWIRNAVQNASFDSVFNLAFPPPLTDRLKTLKAELDGVRSKIEGYRRQIAGLDDYGRLKLGLEMLRELEDFATYYDRILAVMRLADGKRRQLQETAASLDRLLNGLKTKYIQDLTEPLLNKGVLPARAALSLLPPPIRAAFDPVLAALEADLNNLPNKLPDETPAALKATFELIRGLPEQLASQFRVLLEQLDQFVRSEEFLKDILGQLGVPSFITLKYEWKPELTENGLFIPRGGEKREAASLLIKSVYKQSLIGERSSEVTVSGELANFQIVLLPSLPCITIDFDSVSFYSKNGSKPETKVKINEVIFGEALKWVEELQQMLNPSEGPYLIVQPRGIEAGYRFAVPMLTFGSFNLYMLRIGTAIKLPFTGEPVSFRFYFSDRARPFMLAYGIFGGGGFLGLEIDSEKHITIDGALEFGVVGAITIGFAHGVGLVTAGIYMKFSDPNSEICGFNRASGEVDILSLVTVSLDVYVSICWRKSDNCLYGWAEVTIKIKYYFFKLKVKLRVERKFAGGSSSTSRTQTLGIRDQAALPPHEEKCCSTPQVMDWKTYREAFA